MEANMRCKVCGRESQNEGANFCDYCGNSFREQAQAPYHVDFRQHEMQSNQGYYPNTMGMQYQQGNPAQGFQGQGYPQNLEDNRPTTFLNWLGTYGILFIPFVGWLIFLIMLIVWSVSGNTPASKKNWARATLIFSAIMFIIVVIYLFIVIMSMDPELIKQIQSGTFDYDTYNQILREYK